MKKWFQYCVTLLILLVLVFTLGSCRDRDVQDEAIEDTNDPVSEKGPHAESSEASSEQGSAPTDSVSKAPTAESKKSTEASPAPKPAIVEVTIPEGTVFELELLTALDTSVNRAGDEIQARTISPVYLKGEPVLAQGTYVEGSVTEVQASGKVKGRARLAFTFDKLSTQAGVMDVKTSYVDKEASSGKKKDATIIGGGAGVGALVGGILGGKKGAAIGAAIGGAGGTAVVLTTSGDEIKLPVGTEVNVRLDTPVTIQLN
jgi:hypothetical protein